MRKTFIIWLAITIVFLGIWLPIFLIVNSALSSSTADYNYRKKIHDEWLQSDNAKRYSETPGYYFFSYGFSNLGNDNSPELPQTSDLNDEAWRQAGVEPGYPSQYEDEQNKDGNIQAILMVIFYVYLLFCAAYWIIAWGNRGKETSVNP